MNVEEALSRRAARIPFFCSVRKAATPRFL